MLTLILILIVLRMLGGGWYWRRPWDMWGMWHRPPMRFGGMWRGMGPGMGPGHGFGRFGRF